MKKLIFLLIILLSLSGCSIRSYDEITYKEYNSMIKNKEDFVLYIGSATCSHCKEFSPILKSFIKEYQLDIKYIDISKLSEKEYSLLKNKTKVQGTPTIVFVHNGVVDSGSMNKIEGTSTKEELKKIFKRKGYIE